MTQIAQIAQIEFNGGALLLPARDPYDREVVFEQAEFYARRHGAVGLRMGHAVMRVSRSTAESVPACTHCGHPVGWIGYQLREQRFCSHCVKTAHLA